MFEDGATFWIVLFIEVLTLIVELLLLTVVVEVVVVFTEFGGVLVFDMVVLLYATV